MAPDNSEILARQLEQLVLANEMEKVLALADRMQKLYPASTVPAESKAAIFLKRNLETEPASTLHAAGLEIALQMIERHVHGGSRP